MPAILCFGEVLWDLLPLGRFLGGAPLNVAYHLARLGSAPRLVSAVGPGQLGDEALDAIRAADIDATHVARAAELPTGTAKVTLAPGGHASFSLPEPVAWDEIPVEAATHDAAPAAIVFGTLALRRPPNRAALATLLDAFPSAWVVCDLNLRPPHDDLSPLAALLGRAHLLKLNEHEAAVLAPGVSDLRSAAAHVQARYGARAVCITRGGDGAALAIDRAWHQAKAPKITLRDPVGAGDAFTAALVAGALAGGATPDWPRVLSRSCALGAFVASRDGAQPRYRAEDV